MGNANLDQKLSTPVSVADGGTGSGSHTAYAVVCGGTTATGDLQSIASVGTSGQVLTSNGAGALPTFQAAASATTNFPGVSMGVSGWHSLAQPVTSTTNVSAVDDRLVFSPFYHTEEITLSEVGISVSGNVAGATARLGLWSFEGSTGLFTLVEDWGTVSCASLGMATISVSTTLTGGVHHFYSVNVDENAGSVSLSGSSNTPPAFWNDASFQVARTMYQSGVDPVNPLAATVTWASLTNGSTAAGPMLFYS